MNVYDLLMCHLTQCLLQFEQSDRNRAKQGVCTLLGVTTLLGLTWGLVFFSFGSLTTAGLYLFCILNPLQGLHNLLLHPTLVFSYMLYGDAVLNALGKRLVGSIFQ